MSAPTRRLARLVTGLAIAAGTFAMPATAAHADGLPDPVTVISPVTSPYTNAFTPGEDETATDQALDQNLPPAAADAVGNSLDAIDLVETLTGHDGTVSGGQIETASSGQELGEHGHLPTRMPPDR